jgi:hypothetical protein
VFVCGKYYSGTSVRLWTLVIIRITIWIFFASLLGTCNLASRLRNTNKHFWHRCRGRLRITCRHFAMFIIVTGIKYLPMQANFECFLCMTCSSHAPDLIKPQPAPAILSQESVHTMLLITYHTRKQPSTDPRTTQALTLAPP